MPWTFVKRHQNRLGVVVLLGLLVLLSGYQVYAWRVQHRNATTAEKVETLSEGQCDTTILLYRLLNALMDDTSPSFGSPPDGPIIPGARTALIESVRNAENASLAGLRKQGCTVTGIP